MIKQQQEGGGGVGEGGSEGGGLGTGGEGYNNLQQPASEHQFEDVPPPRRDDVGMVRREVGLGVEIRRDGRGASWQGGCSLSRWWLLYELFLVRSASAMVKPQIHRNIILLDQL